MSTAETTSEQLLERIYSVSFCQLMRCIQIEQGSRIGMERDIEKQPVQLVADLDANFPANELASWTDSEPRPKLAVSFFGLFGPNGALPHHYTQMILERVRQKDETLREFLDMFNHRLLSLFYRAWEKHSFPVGFETAYACQAEDTLKRAMWAVVGNRLDSSRSRLSFEDDVLLYYGGQFASRRPTAESLRACVQDFTGIDAKVESLVGQWLTLERSEQTQVGSAPMGTLLSNALGVDSIVGERVWDAENRFRVIIGPVDWKGFNEYLPPYQPLRLLTDLVRRYVGPQFDFDVQVILSRDAIQGVVLDVESAFYLGWNTWLGEWQSPLDADQSVFELPDVVDHCVSSTAV